MNGNLDSVVWMAFLLVCVQLWRSRDKTASIVWVVGGIALLVIGVVLAIS